VIVDMDEDSASSLLHTTRLTHRVGLIICATMMLVLSTHYFDATTRTRELFDRLEIYAQDFENNNPCRYSKADLKDELESRTQLDFRAVELGYVGPPLPSGPAVDVFIDSKQLYQPRCARPDIAEALDELSVMLKKNRTSADLERVKGELQVRHVDGTEHFDVELVGLHRQTGVDKLDDPAGTADRVSLTIPIKRQTSYAEWLEHQHGFDQASLEETSSLVQRRSMRGAVEGLTFGEASKVLEALSHPEHDRITLFGFNAPTTAIGVLGAPVLLAYCVLLLTYLVQIKERMAGEPHVIRRFPWFVTMTGRLPAMLTNLTLVAPVVTSAAIFFRLGIGSANVTAEGTATAVISLICMIAMLPILFAINETLARIRPGKDPVLEAARRSRVDEVVSLARIGTTLKELRVAKHVSLGAIEESFEISSKLLDDFERGRGDLPVSYLMLVAGAIESELMLVPVRRLPDGSLVGVEISITETINRIAEEEDL
jgi:hypothetical protein